MYEPEIKLSRSGVPVLSRKEIEQIGEILVREFAPRILETPQALNVDLFAQDYLGLEQDFQYLSHCGLYLGMTVFNDTDSIPVYDPENGCAKYIGARAKTVIIDCLLLEKNQENRYRFTMAHEASHAFLHKDYFAERPPILPGMRVRRLKILKDTSLPLVRCRMDSVAAVPPRQPDGWDDLDWMEWQANTLAAVLLMPAQAVRIAAESAEKEMSGDHDRLATYIASVFHVSSEAAGYRLKQLGM